MAIPFLNHLDLRSVSELQNAILHKTTTTAATNVEGKFLYDTATSTMQYYNGTAWINLDGAGDIAGVTAGNYLNGGGTSGTVTLNHDLTSRADTTSTDAPGYGGTFEAVTSVTTNNYGHVTAIDVSTVTIPASDDTTYDLESDQSGSDVVLLLNGSDTSQDSVKFVAGTNITLTDNGSNQITVDAANQGTVTGSGTANTVPKWSTGGTGIEDSSISDDGTTVTIVGNLDVQGTTTTIDSTTVAIGDNMMKYAKDNTANASDIGWYGKIVSSGTKYPGMWYDASTGISTPKFVLGIATAEPAGTGTIATAGILVASLEGNADTASALFQSHSFSITGDITAAAENFNGQQNIILDASIDANVVGASELKVGSNGTAGQVLASDGDGTFSWANAGTNTQLATAAALIDVSAMAGNNTASFTHGLSSKNLIVQLYDTTSGNIVHADVDHTSSSAISIIFSLTGTELVADGIGDIRVVVIDAKNGLTDKTVSYS